MNAEIFQLIDETVIDNSIMKRNFSKIDHQQGVTQNDSGKNFNFIFGENSKCFGMGNA